MNDDDLPELPDADPTSGAPSDDPAFPDPVAEEPGRIDGPPPGWPQDHDEDRGDEDRGAGAHDPASTGDARDEASRDEQSWRRPPPADEIVLDLGEDEPVTGDAAEVGDPGADDDLRAAEDTGAPGDVVDGEPLALEDVLAPDGWPPPELGCLEPAALVAAVELLDGDTAALRDALGALEGGELEVRGGAVLLDAIGFDVRVGHGSARGLDVALERGDEVVIGVVDAGPAAIVTVDPDTDEVVVERLPGLERLTVDRGELLRRWSAASFETLTATEPGRDLVALLPVVVPSVADGGFPGVDAAGDASRSSRRSGRHAVEDADPSPQEG